MEELGNVLKSVYVEIKKEGYRMVDGKIIKIERDERENTG